MVHKKIKVNVKNYVNQIFFTCNTVISMKNLYLQGFHFHQYFQKKSENISQNPSLQSEHKFSLNKLSSADISILAIKIFRLKMGS